MNVEPLPRLALGLATGIVFGILLQKGRVAKFDVIVRQFQLRDFTVLKVMLTAIVVGGVGVHALNAAGLAALHVKPALLGAIALGGVLFGLGMALLGYCPGTALAAAGEGSRHALAGIAGMLCGALLFTETFAALSGGVMKLGDLGKLTLPSVTGLPAWALLGLLALIWLAAWTGLRRLESRRPAAG